MNGWPALTRHGPDASAPQKPEKRQSLSVVVQALAVSVHEESLYGSAGERLRSLNQILSQLLRHRRVKNHVARVAELAIGNKQMRGSVLSFTSSTLRARASPIRRPVLAKSPISA